MKTKYFLFSGVGRSGTTALRKAFGCHPEIYYNGLENNIVQNVISCALRNCTAGRKEWMAVPQERYDELFRNLLTDLLWPEPGGRVDKTLMCAINPSMEIADYTRQVFGDCKFVYLVRNGIEVISSRQRFPPFSLRSFSEHCDVWLRARGMLQWGRNNPEHFREFRHEWLIDEKQAGRRFSDVFTWLGLSQCPACAEHILSNRYHPTSEASGPIAAVVDAAHLVKSDREKLTDDRRGRWRSWQPEEISLFEEKCGAFMAELGYELPWKTERNDHAV